MYFQELIARKTRWFYRLFLSFMGIYNLFYLLYNEKKWKWRVVLFKLKWWKSQVRSAWWMSSIKDIFTWLQAAEMAIWLNHQPGNKVIVPWITIMWTLSWNMQHHFQVWGILSCGNFSVDFFLASTLLVNHTVLFLFWKVSSITCIQIKNKE